MSDEVAALAAAAADYRAKMARRPRAGRFQRLVARRPWVTFDMLGHKGQLGNQLFQIAAAVALARRLGIDYFFPHWAYAHHFRGPFPRRRFLHVPWDEPSVGTDAARQHHYRPIDTPAPVLLDAFYQSERYFEDAAGEIHRIFTPRPALVARLRLRHGALLDRRPWALHVRRGDYLATDSLACLDATDYYDRALAHAAPDTPVLICSDDIPFCRTYFRGDRFHFVDGQSDVEDMILMSLCAGNIIANSSFSWWAAWLGETPGKPIVAPIAWFAGRLADPTIPYAQLGYHDTRDMIPRRWLRI